METEHHDQGPSEDSLDGPEDRQERLLYFERKIIESIWDTLPSVLKVRLHAKALARRVECVRDLKRKNGEQDWEWRPGAPLDEEDDIVQAFLGPGTWSIYLPEVLAEELTGLKFSADHIDEIERILGVDTRAAVIARRRLGVPWWLPAEAWTTPPERAG